MRKSKAAWFFAAALSLCRPSGAAAQASDSERLRVYQDFVRHADAGQKTAAANFSIGEIMLDDGLKALSADADYAKNPRLAPLPGAAVKSIEEAAAAYEEALKSSINEASQDTASQRLGELSYDLRDWRGAEQRFKGILASRHDTYVKPQSLIGLGATYAALGDFTEADKALRVIQRDFPEYQKDPNVAFLDGVTALHQGRFADAERWLKGLDSPQARYFLGRNYLLWGKPLLAASVFNQLNEDAPPPSLREPARFFLADAFFMSKDYDGASSHYGAFLSDFPSSALKVAAIYRIGATYFEKGDYERARRAFEDVAKSGDRYYGPLASYFIGESYLATGRRQEALSVFSGLAAERADWRPLALYQRAWIQKSLGDYSGSLDTYNRFLKFYPASPLAANVYLIMGGMMAERKDVKNALSDYERVLDIAPKSDTAQQALFLMLKLQYDLKNYGYIVTSYHYLLDQLAPSASRWKSFSYLLVADTDLRLGRVKEARALYESLLGTYANDVATIYAQDGIAWCDELLGQDKQAVIDRQKVRTMIELAASSSTLANLNDLGLADSFYAQKDYADAYDFYAKFAKEHPDLPAAATALYRAGDSLFRQRYYSQAVDVWRDLVAHSSAAPEAEKASFRVADTLFRAGNYAQARAEYLRLQDSSYDQAKEQAAFIVLRLAQSAYYLKDMPKALSMSKDIVTHYPQAPEAGDALDLAEAIFEQPGQGDFPSFIHDMIAANPGTPAAAQAQFRLARWLYDRKDYAKAALEFERFSVGHAGDPHLAEAQLYLGQSYFLLKDYAKAAPAFERYAASYPSTPEASLALFDLGNAYYSLKQYDKVAAPYQKLISAYPDSQYAQPARFNLALAYQESGQLDRAWAGYEAYLGASKAPEQAFAALWNIFDIERKKASYLDAIKTLKRIIAVSKGSGQDALEAAYRLGETQLTIGDEPQARKAWEALARMRPQASPYRLQGLIQLSKLYEKSREFAKALTVYRDLARNSADPSVTQAARARIQELRAAGSAKAHE